MLRFRRWPLLPVALLVAITLVGCGGTSRHTAAPSAKPATDAGSTASGGGDGAPGAPGSNGSGGAPGAPGGSGQNGAGNSPTAPGAPIMIPDIVLLYGQPINAAINSLEYGSPLPGETNGYNGVVAQCGGTLCVTIETKVDAAFANLSHCVASGVTDPPYNSVVARGSTIWVLTGGAPCEPWETPYPPSQSPSGQTSPSPSGQPTPSPSGQPAPTDSPSP
jgi:hypothetical protein